MELRKARPDDADAIASFTTRTFAWGDYIPEAIADWIEDQSGQVVVGTDGNDVPVAMGRVELLTPKEAWLLGARVHPDWRGRGIATLLAKELTDWARQQGALVARLLIEESNTSSIHNIQKTKFRKTTIAHRGVRELNTPSPHRTGNGGTRRRSPLTVRQGTWVDAEIIAAAWSTSEAGRSLRGLFGQSWSFHRLRTIDVERAAREGRLWEIGSAWAITAEHEGRFEVQMLDASPSDAVDVVRALVDHAHDSGASEFSAWVADCSWLTDALATAGCDTEPSGIYSMAL